MKIATKNNHSFIFKSAIVAKDITDHGFVSSGMEVHHFPKVSFILCKLRHQDEKGLVDIANEGYICFHLNVAEWAIDVEYCAFIFGFMKPKSSTHTLN